jgi:putative hemolysin
MLPIELRIDRAQKLLQMIEQDAPLLAARVAPLSVEVQESAKSHAQQLAMLTRAEISRLLEEKAFAEVVEPHAAD